MNWAQIVEMYNTACGKATGAAQEWEIHVNEGYRALCSRLNLQELDQEFIVETAAGVDYVGLPANVFAVISIVNLDTADKLTPEVNGMRGRMNFLDPAGTGKPIQGANPTTYAISGGRVFLRDTPNRVVTLKILARARPEPVRDSDMDGRPITGEHLDMAIVHAAARSFYSVHQDADVPSGDGGPKPSDVAAANFERMLQEPDLPKDQERHDQEGRVYLRGFFMRTWR